MKMFYVLGGSVVLAAVLAAVRFGPSLAFQLPEPSGTQAVGTTVLSFPLGEAGDAKYVPLQIWYPTSSSTNSRAPYRLRASTGLRDRLLNSLVRTNASLDAPMLDGRRPFVLYVPGLGGSRARNTALVEELVSNGIIVLAMDETRPEGGFDFSSPALTQDSISWGDRSVALRANDLSRVLDRLKRADGDTTSPIAGKLDFRRIGIVGFSFGGAVAAETARRDERISAAVDLDGWMFGSALRFGVPCPYLVMSTESYDPIAESRGDIRTASDATSFERDDMAMTVAGLRRYGGYFVAIDRIRHRDFTDAIFIPSLTLSADRLSPERGYRVVGTYVRDFFERAFFRRRVDSFDSVGHRDDLVELTSFPSVKAPRSGSFGRYVRSR